MDCFIFKLCGERAFSLSHRPNIYPCWLHDYACLKLYICLEVVYSFLA